MTDIIYQLTADDGEHSTILSEHSTHSEALIELKKLVATASTTEEFNAEDGTDLEIIKTDDDNLYEPMECYDTLRGWVD